MNDEKLTIGWIQILRNNWSENLIAMGLRETRRR